ncbi:hypothetical protein J437_LFUL016094 [Ladona fulva]|uniref:Uncharacterized protein n=1 Tax=Ladona fulva TaxID=123851 RepID=A0A8K0P8D9_LADFU|nr:hypothetical protein J437_LFUL016094 [Ladona fulva]
MLLTLRFLIAEILPHNDKGYEETKEFLLKLVDLLMEFIKESNDRGDGVGAKGEKKGKVNPRRGKILEFLHPEEMKEVLDLDVPEKARTLQQLINDCAVTLKHSVKTGE